MSDRTTRRAVLRGVGAAAAGVSLTGCLGALTDDEPDAYSTPAATAFDAVVDAKWLADGLDDVALLDVRDEAAFTEGHLPGAHRLPDTELLRNHYRETADGYEASPERIAEIVADAGVAPGDDVVVYGGGSSLWETYAIYTLNAIGHAGQVSLLDGGYAVWTDADGETADGTPESRPVASEPAVDTSVVATRARVREAVTGDAAVQLVDNRTPAEYEGTEKDDQTSRHGHIPGAINVHFRQNLVDDGTRLRSPADLERLWLDAAGLDPSVETISYCSTAVRGSVGWFLMRQLGWETVRNYEGSWHDWGTLSETNGYPYVSGPGSGEVVDVFA